MLTTDISTYNTLLDTIMPIICEDGLMLQHVPKEKITYWACFNAVEQNSNALKFVPNKFKSVDICITAIKNSIFALRYIPLDLYGDILSELF